MTTVLPASVLLEFRLRRPPSFGFRQQPRLASVKREFQLMHPYPANGRSGACPGYVKDHVLPLACGGPDAPSNMQWQTKSEAKAKDRWETRSGAR